VQILQQSRDLSTILLYEDIPCFGIKKPYQGKELETKMTTKENAKDIKAKDDIRKAN